MDRFLVAIIGIPIAFAILYFRKQILDFFGKIDWAEKYLGSTFNLILLIAFLVFLGSLMYAVGTLQAFLEGTVGKLF